MKIVFLAHHTARAGSDHEDVKLLGVYESKNLAEAAIEELKTKPGFRDPGGVFEVNECEINKIHWPEGYGNAWE